ncbi:hypothetical protein C900_02484 [Fulvivirga imtechensis AK7]|uniref:Uncharacterized protein n=1 Tax=Fulvivirga imtechensis AK7 TaxID=1237149 RepID=L8JVD3_9BACT|nr:DUF1028 domain-containing protein [Fulvivirga imtechensis]ELR71569.1 hypothetical protein C900_02484 [Fulvivirga imtechensis AK7]
MLKIAICLLILGASDALFAQVYLQNEPFSHTYSIVARDPETGEMAVGVQSHWFSVGTVVSWGEAGVGVVATQSFVNKSFGPLGLQLLKDGKTANEALKILLRSDEGREVRQVAIVDARGNVATHTGDKCIAYAGHQQGENYSVQANMMLTKEVWPAMADAYEKSSGLPLAERVIIALEAAEKAGGDIRGKQSAALLVVKGQPVKNSWDDPMINLRVDDHTNPVEELKRLLKVYRAYEHMNKGDLAVEVGDMSLALQEYGKAQSMFPHNLEMQYWTAVTLANNHRIEEALPIFERVFRENENWRELTRRLPDAGLLDIKRKELKKILKLK